MKKESYDAYWALLEAGLVPDDEVDYENMENPDAPAVLDFHEFFKDREIKHDENSV